MLRVDADTGNAERAFPVLRRGGLDRDPDRAFVDAQIGARHRVGVVDCEVCSGVLKPDVVYFGESVPPTRVEAAYAEVDGARSLLVLGSSLHVFSGRRFVIRAAQRGIPIAIVNAGPTRGDDLATLKLEAPLGDTLASVADALGAEMSPAGHR